MSRFKYEIEVDGELGAESIAEALKNLEHKYPNARIMHIAMDGQTLGQAYSNKAARRVYYRPGCLCGMVDCILDPMEDIAEECRNEAETEKKWRPCPHHKPSPRDGCANYDDECK